MPLKNRVAEIEPNIREQVKGGKILSTSKLVAPIKGASRGGVLIRFRKDKFSFCLGHAHSEGFCNDTCAGESLYTVEQINTLCKKDGGLEVTISHSENNEKSEIVFSRKVLLNACAHLMVVEKVLEESHTRIQKRMRGQVIYRRHKK